MSIAKHDLPRQMTKTLDGHYEESDAEQEAARMSEPERKVYNRWRVRILISVIIGYGTYYLCRQNFAMIMPAFMEEFGYRKKDLGTILSAAAIIYGVGKFVNGYASDKSDARNFMSVGLFCSAIATFFLGFTNSLIFLGLLWVINNWFQSMGWPPVARMLTHWYAPHELGTKWALAAASHQIGGALTVIFTGYLVSEIGWRYAFYIPGVIAFAVVYFLYDRLRDSPEQLGMPPVEHYKNQELQSSSQEDEHLTTMQILLRVFYNRNMWLVCMANLCVYIVRIGVLSWAPVFLKEIKGITLTEAGWHVAAYEVTGLAGGYFAGWLSDKFFPKKRGFVGALYMICLAGTLVIYWYVPSQNTILCAVVSSMAGFFVYGPQVLVGVASADFASKKAVGTANGLAGTMAYLGAAISGYPVGWLVDFLGWMAAFGFFFIAAMLGALFFSLTIKGKVS